MLPEKILVENTVFYECTNGGIYMNELTEDKINDLENEVEQIEKESLNKENTTDSETSKKRSKASKPVRSFPQFSIKESMQISKVIGAQNAGNPWLVEHVATALNTSKGTNSFFYLTSASRDYGFTTGTSRAKTIELTALGRKIAFPESADDEVQAIWDAFCNVEVFKNVYDYYQGSSYPEDRYFCNTLKENFNVDTIYHQEFLEIFKSNLELINQNRQIVQGGLPVAASLNAQSSHLDTISQENIGELFVIMPFSEKTAEYPKGYFDEVYSSLLVPAAAEAGLTAKTAKRSGSDIIHSTIVSDIYNAQIVLADLTEHNPNVLFELGLAIAFKKRVVLIRAKGTPAIFDVDNLMRVYDYDRNLWKSTIERDVPNLSKHIQAALQSEGTMYLDILLKK